MANRLVQEGSDARLEALFGDGPAEGEEGGEVLPDSIGQVNSWEDGAAEVANMIGAEVCTEYQSCSSTQKHPGASFVLDGRDSVQLMRQAMTYGASKYRTPVDGKPLRVSNEGVDR